MKLLSLALGASLLIFAIASSGRAASGRFDPRQLARAEDLLRLLEQFDISINSGPNTKQYKARIARLSNSFARTAARLPESDIKTDMATAVYWYEQLDVGLNHSPSAVPGETVRCSNERPGAYQRLCECTSGSTRDLLWAKARLHLSWARGAITFQKTGRIERPLDDLAIERSIDRMLADLVIQSLRNLQSKVIVYRSLGDFEAGGKLARVPLAVFKGELQKALIDHEITLSWLPQNRLKSELSNALHSFEDGAYWWQQIDQPRVVKVSELAFRNQYTSAPHAALMTTVPYTVAVHWRHASDYLQQAEELLSH